MKKRVLGFFLAAVFLVLVWLFYMEFHYGGVALVSVDSSAEQIETEMPNILVSETDRSMVRALLTSPLLKEAIAAVSDGEDTAYTLSQNDSESLLAEYLPEGYRVFEVSVFDGSVYVVLQKDEEKAVSYTFDPEGVIHEKSICIYGNDFFKTRTVKVLYSNVNGRLTKQRDKRLLFAWLRRK